MDISLKIIQKVEFDFHSQTIFNFHIVVNMFLNLHYVVKFLLIAISYIWKFKDIFRQQLFFITKWYF
jgi:hypothetical protein